ncbi:polysaccharide pyruvyl transferase family protein [Oerskovia merdavium]|uniref:Polysaccharide pyruvyl transferase family protein n=1 Tax=Oerskovia merdavium TaxID=2762227 RepID=A0ABR8TUG1_9CELL|nr:polysaccharide pyruvyl transferase family protein [Oerskovia merdavium]MBD7979426.1 polysaccharide pyruvyl transferase family protein [Oerskovia merdavium]
MARRSKVGGNEPLKVGLYGGFGTGNIGNDATARVVAEHVRGHHDDVEVVLVSYADETTPSTSIDHLPLMTLGEPVEERGRTRVGRAVHRRWQSVRQLGRDWTITRQFDAMVITGGGVFEAESTAAAGGLVGAVGFFLLALVSSHRHHHFATLSIGGTSMRRSLERFLLVRSMRYAEYRSFRDAASKDALVGMHGAQDDDRVSSDLVFATPMISRASRTQSGPKRVAIGVMRFPWLGEGWADELARTAYVQALADVVEHLLPTSTVAVFGGDKADAPVIEALVRVVEGRVGHEVVLHRVEVWGSPAFHDTVERLCDVDVVVCSRYHNLVAAFLRGTGVIAVADRVKVRSLMREAGVSDLVVEARGLDGQDLVERIEHVVAHLDDVRAAVSSTTRQFALSAEAQLRELDDLLERWNKGRHGGRAHQSVVERLPARPSL